MGSDIGGSAKIHLCRYLQECGIEGGERVRPSRKQIMADLSCDDSTSVGTPVPVGAARRDPRRGEIPVMCGQAQFPFLPWMAFCHPCLEKYIYSGLEENLFLKLARFLNECTPGELQFLAETRYDARLDNTMMAASLYQYGLLMLETQENG